MAGVDKSRTTPHHPMGNGMFERFYQTLNMLGTLEDHQKEDWKSYIAPLVHSYNATRHDSTGYSPFFLMFGRHPRLAVDTYLGLNSAEEPEVRSKEHYTTKLKKCLQFVYKDVSNEARKSADSHKRHYGMKVREATLDVNDRVLVRQVGFRGDHKIADRWEKNPYVVIQILNQDVPVYRVQKESNDQIIKTLHRNMLLPFNAIPGKLEIPETLARPQRPRNVARNFQDEDISEHESDSDNADSETHSFIQPLYPVVQQRRKKSGRQNGGVLPSPVLGDSTGFHVIDSLTDPTAIIPGTPVTFPLDSIGQPSESLTQSNVSYPHASPGLPTPVQELIRRSNRVRKAPNMYGEWVSGQLVVDNPESQEHFV